MDFDIFLLVFFTLHQVHLVESKVINYTTTMHNAFVPFGPVICPLCEISFTNFRFLSASFHLRSIHLLLTSLVIQSLPACYLSSILLYNAILRLRSVPFECINITKPYCNYAHDFTFSYSIIIVAFLLTLSDFYAFTEKLCCMSVDMSGAPQ